MRPRKIEFFIIVLILLMTLILVACSSSSNHEGEAKTPSASSAQKGRNYQDVMADFEKKGFTNIRTEVLEDLVTGWLTKDGEVKSVSVDGDEDYSADRWYPNDVEVIITYHTFPSNKSDKTSDSTSSIEADIEPSLESTFPSVHALRAAVVAFTNLYAGDIWTDDGDVDPSKLHSFDDMSGDVSEYFMFIKSEGTWTAKNENTWHVEGLQLERYTKFVEKDISFGVNINVSLDVSYDGENYIVSNLAGKTTYHDDMSWIEEDQLYVRTYLAVPLELIKDYRDTSKEKALDGRKGRKGDRSTAQRALEYVGKELYPYGFEINWWTDLEESIQAHDGSWYLRANVTITNHFGASRKATAEAVINQATEAVENFNVY